MHSQQHLNQDQQRAHLFINNIFQDVITKRQSLTNNRSQSLTREITLKHDNQSFKKHQSSHDLHNKTKSRPQSNDYFLGSKEITDITKESPKVCKFCKQTVNISMIDDCDVHHLKREKNLGYYNYNFVFNYDKKSYKTKNSQLMKQSNLKLSANLVSVDFDLSETQHRDNQDIQGKEKQSQEIYTSQVISQIFPKPPTTTDSDLLNFKTISTEIARSQQGLQFRKSQEDLIQQKQKQEMSKENRYQNNMQEKGQQEKNKNYQDLIVPNEEKMENANKKRLKSYIIKEYISEPIELDEEKKQKKENQEDGKQQSPLTKLLDMIDVSDIDMRSQITSPSNTFQHNLIYEFEKQMKKETSPLKNKINRQLQQKKQKTFTSAFGSTVSNSCSKQKLRKQKQQNENSQNQTLYQKILNAKKMI